MEKTLNILTLVSPIVAPLIVSVILWLFTRRRLFLAVPKYFQHSNLSENAQTVELTIANRSYKSEEDVTIGLDPIISVQILGSTSATSQVYGNLIKIDRISPNEEVSILLLVEGGQLKHDTIGSFSSKNASGRIVKRVEDIPAALLPNVLGLSILFAFLIGFPTAAYFFGKQEGAFNEKYKTVTQDTLPKELLSFKWYNLENYVRSDLFGPLTEKFFPMRVEESIKSGHLVVIPLIVENPSDSVLVITSAETITPTNRLAPKDFFEGVINPDGLERRRHNLSIGPESSELFLFYAHQDENIGVPILLEVNLSYKSKDVYNLRYEINDNEIKVLETSDQLIGKVNELIKEFYPQEQKEETSP